MIKLKDIQYNMIFPNYFNSISFFNGFGLLRHHVSLSVVGNVKISF